MGHGSLILTRIIQNTKVWKLVQDWKKWLLGKVKPTTHVQTFAIKIHLLICETMQYAAVNILAEIEHLEKGVGVFLETCGWDVHPLFAWLHCFPSIRQFGWRSCWCCCSICCCWWWRWSDLCVVKHLEFCWKAVRQRALTLGWCASCANIFHWKTISANSHISLINVHIYNLTVLPVSSIYLLDMQNAMDLQNVYSWWSPSAPLWWCSF